MNTDPGRFKKSARFGSTMIALITPISNP